MTTEDKVCLFYSIVFTSIEWDTSEINGEYGCWQDI